MYLILSIYITKNNGAAQQIKILNTVYVQRKYVRVYFHKTFFRIDVTRKLSAIHLLLLLLITVIGAESCFTDLHYAVFSVF